ncbi:22721_t:CDS:2, partial [Gigaspora margarita]
DSDDSYGNKGNQFCETGENSPTLSDEDIELKIWEPQSAESLNSESSTSDPIPQPVNSDENEYIEVTVIKNVDEKGNDDHTKSPSPRSTTSSSIPQTVNSC